MSVIYVIVTPAKLSQKYFFQIKANNQALVNCVFIRVNLRCYVMKPSCLSLILKGICEYVKMNTKCAIFIENVARMLLGL